MKSRRPLYAVTVGLVLVFGSSARADGPVRTQNFIVTAPNQAIATQFGQLAEQYRKQKAMEWLGQEMPNWPRPCPLYIKVKAGGPGGATKFNYDFRGNYEVLSMEIEGDMERMQNSVLPHEITHTVFAHYFRYPVPRWADEGGSVLSEDDRERQTHDRLCRDKLNHQQAVSLRRLFALKEYGEVPDVMVIYAQGYSISQYLVNQGGRQAFLGFVATGMREGWDKATQTYFHMQSVDAMEVAWKQNLIDIKAGRAIMAKNNAQPPTRGELTSLVRDTAPPAQPQLDPAGPVVRGQSDDDARHAALMPGRQGYLPEPQGQAMPPLRLPPPPAAAVPRVTTPVPPPVRLGVPQFGPGPATQVPTTPPGVGTTVGRGN